MDLTPKQQTFVLEYLKDGNATQAAIRAGYSARSAGAIAAETLKNPNVSAAIEARRAKAVAKLEISVERVLAERARLAFYDPAKLLGVQSIEDIKNLDEDTRRAIQGFEVGPGGEVKVKAAEKEKSLAALEKHLGMYKDDSGAAPPLTINIHLGDL